MNELLTSDPGRLDTEAIHMLREVADSLAMKQSESGGGDPATSDVSGINIVSATTKPQQRADAFAAHLIWLSEAPLLPGRGYLLKAGTQTVGASSRVSVVLIITP